MQVTSPRDLSKPALRRLLRAGRPDPESQRAQSAEIRRHLRLWLADRPPGVIAAFSAIPGEPLLLPLLAELPQYRWVLPRMEGTALAFHFTATADPGAFAAGAFGIAEPPADSPACPAAEIGIFLCPGMAFTRGGTRLGRGKGYYDRALAAAGGAALRVGVCFRDQVLAEIPAEGHDLPMHFLATPEGVAECTAVP